MSMSRVLCGFSAFVDSAILNGSITRSNNNNINNVQRSFLKVLSGSTSRRYSSRPIHDSGSGDSNSNSNSNSEKDKKRRRKTTILTLKGLHEKGEAISMMTAHDYPSALYVEKAGIEVLLVGDSLAMVALGYPSTTSVTMDVSHFFPFPFLYCIPTLFLLVFFFFQKTKTKTKTNKKQKQEMLHHCRAVSRGASLPFLVGDMPFGSYQVSSEAAVSNAVRFVKEGNMEVLFFLASSFYACACACICTCTYTCICVSSNLYSCLVLFDLGCED
jgi:hypothetical protein